MSNALAIAGVTAVLQSMLNSVYNAAGLGSVTVSSLAPDLVQDAIASGADEPLTVNLFLHQVTLNAAWRNIALPSLAADGSTPLKNPPLALDLHYLMTAYGSQSYQAEALLGYGIQMLHGTPVLPRSQISAALSGLTTTDPTNALSGPLGSSGLDSQIEMIKITPATLGREEMAWLWTALKADYRPTFPFQVSVVLIQAPAPASAALPVLTRTVTVQPGFSSGFLFLTAASPQKGQPAACLGDTVTVAGTGLSGVTGVTLTNARLQVTQAVGPVTVSGSGSLSFAVPNPPAPSPGNPPTDLPAGMYQVTAQAPAGSLTVNSNGVPLAVAPRIGAGWPAGSVASGGPVTLTVPCAPYLRPGQQATLYIGGQGLPADPITAPTAAPSFSSPGLAKTSGAVPVWLSVDGVDSPILDMTQSPPVFAAPTIQVT